MEAFPSFLGPSRVYLCGQIFCITSLIGQKVIASLRGNVGARSSERKRPFTTRGSVRGHLSQACWLLYSEKPCDTWFGSKIWHSPVKGRRQKGRFLSLGSYNTMDVDGISSTFVASCALDGDYSITLKSARRHLFFFYEP